MVRDFGVQSHIPVLRDAETVPDVLLVDMSLNDMKNTSYTLNETDPLAFDVTERYRMLSAGIFNTP